MEKLFDELSSELKSNSLKFTNVDVETQFGVDLSCKYQVRNVPTIIIVNKNKVIERITGTRTKQELKDIIEKWK